MSAAASRRVLAGALVLAAVGLAATGEVAAQTSHDANWQPPTTHGSDWMQGDHWTTAAWPNNTDTDVYDVTIDSTFGLSDDTAPFTVVFGSAATVGINRLTITAGVPPAPAGVEGGSNVLSLGGENEDAPRRVLVLVPEVAGNRITLYRDDGGSAPVFGTIELMSVMEIHGGTVASDGLIDVVPTRTENMGFEPDPMVGQFASGLYLSGAVTFSSPTGQGRVLLDDNSDRFATIEAIPDELGNPATLVNEVGHTFAGRGAIGPKPMEDPVLMGGPMAMEEPLPPPPEMVIDNRGLISAEQGALQLNGNDSSANSGTLRAWDDGSAGGGTLIIEGADWNNAGGVILGDGESSEVQLKEALVAGGTVGHSNGGTVALYGATLTDVTLQGMSGGGEILVPAEAPFEPMVGIAPAAAAPPPNFATLSGTVILDGVTLTSEGETLMDLNADVRVKGDVVLGGGGVFRLAPDATGTLVGEDSGPSTLTLEEGHTLAGSGLLGGYQMTIVNNGTIMADDPGDALTYGTPSQVCVVQNANGVVTTGDESFSDNNVNLFVNASIVGGTLTKSIHGGTNKVAAGGRLVLDGTVDTDGHEILLEGNGGILYVTETSALTGGGTIAMLGGSDNTVAKVPILPDAVLTNVDNRIRGAGEILAPLHNLSGGVVCASLSGWALELTTEAKTNDGLFQATGEGVLQAFVSVSGNGQWGADGGTIIIGPADGISVEGGSLWTSQGGEVEIYAPATFESVDLDADATLQVEDVLTVTGDLTFAMTDETEWSWSSDGVLKMVGGGGTEEGDWALFEIGSADGGGFVDNFALQTLQIGENGHVRLVDAVDNGNRSSPEALYVDTLEFLDADGTLDIGDYSLYYNTLIGDESQIVPEPATLALVGLGGLALALRRRR